MDIRRVASASDTINLEEEWSKWRIEMLDMLKIVYRNAFAAIQNVR